MRVNVNFHTLAISLLTSSALAAPAQQHGSINFGERPRGPKCGWRCGIQTQINKIKEQLDWITDQLWHPDITSDYPPEDAPGPAPTYRPSSISSSVVTPTPTVTSSVFQSSSTTLLATPTSSKNSYYPTSSPKPVPPCKMGDCGGYRTIGYFTNWGIYGRKYPPQSIPVDKLTHILYAFAKNQEDGTVVLTDKWADQDIHYPGDTWESTGNDLFGNFKALNLLKQQNRNLKVLLSIGGWTFSNTQRLFDAPASTPEGRKQFAVSSVQLLKDFGLDGIDLDWEYPQNPEQGEHLILLLQEIRNHLDEYSESLESRVGEKPHFELTIASSASKSIYDNYHLDRLSGVVDFINLMAYDFAGSWESKSSHQANLYASSSNPGSTPFNIDDTVKGYIAAGTPADKIVLGMPLYGRAFASTTGLGEPFSGVGEGSWENGVWDFKALPQDGSEEIIDEEAGASYSYNGGTQTLVSYDNAEIAARKARYIKDNGLGGGMWWELSGDREGEESLIAVVYNELGDIQDKPNWISYVDSQFDNLKAGFQ